MTDPDAIRTRLKELKKARDDAEERRRSEDEKRRLEELAVEELLVRQLIEAEKKADEQKAVEAAWARVATADENTAKGKATGDNGWTTLAGSGRCATCQKDNTQCVVNLDAIDKWQREAEGGKTFTRHPADTNCKRCTEKKKPCALPATEMMRDAIKVNQAAVAGPSRGSAVPASSSSSSTLKRKYSDEVEFLSRKKMQLSASTREDEYKLAVLTLLRKMEGHLGRLADAQAKK